MCGSKNNGILHALHWNGKKCNFKCGCKIISKTKINILKKFLQSSLLAPLGLFNSKIFPFFALIC